MTVEYLTITMEPHVIKIMDKLRGDVKRSTFLSSLVKQEAESKK